MNRAFRKLTTLAGTLCLCVSASRAHATINTVGGLASAPVFSESGMTFVDVVRSATGAGTYASATVFWAGGTSNCSGLFMLKFYRPDAATGESLTFLTERGPFSTSPGLTDFVLSPAVTLEAGDYVGITELSDGACGAVQLLVGGGNETLSFIGDSGASNITLCDRTEASLIPQSIGVIVRSQSTDSRAGIVLGVGSVQGAAGSNFRTSMQLANPGSGVAIRGSLVFHAIGVPGLSTDPSLDYTLAPGQVLSFPDIVSAIGASGLGSIDVIATDSYAPLVVTRIFNDGGSAGTAGFSEPLVRQGDNFVIESGHSAWLIVPADLTKFRMNLAFRSLSEGATVKIIAHGPDGSTAGSVTKTYAADVFDLESTSQILPGITVTPGGSIEVQVSTGRAIVGGVTVDNTTNDTLLQLGTRTHF